MPHRAKQDRRPTQELLLGARGGDGEALDALCARYIPRLRRWATRRLPEKSRRHFDTDDLVQETIIRAVQDLDGVRAQQGGACQRF